MLNAELKVNERHSDEQVVTVQVGEGRSLCAVEMDVCVLWRWMCVCACVCECHHLYL